ncbi:MAG: hypothetical protein ACI4Q6_07860 [Huintestinicola sp.]
MDITFAVNGSNSFHKLEPAKALLRFTEFDFTYFWEQCIDVGRNARKTGRVSSNMKSVAINALAKCHPYVSACAGTEFSSVVIDCIIAYICHSEGIGLEELWVRCISPKSLYEKEIFERVSEYKTGRGINQWVNIVRMQEYARSKMKFIYECDDNVMLTKKEYRARREYFDLAFLVAANETGCNMRELPSVKKYSPSLLPDGAFMLGRISKNVYRRLSDVLADAEKAENEHLNDHNRDRMALDAFSYVKDMPRPEQIDMNYTIEAISEMPEEVYVPDSFKAMIDLEFTVMYENDIYLSKCPRCGRFFVRDIDEKTPYCRRINSSGRTCTELMDEELDIAARNTNPAERLREEETEQEEKPAIPPRNPIAEEKPAAPIEMPKELEKYCQRVYNLVYRRAGKLMTKSEFNEWAGYLADMKQGYRNGDADTAQVEEFLNYWENAVKASAKKQGRFIKEPEAAKTVTASPVKLADFMETGAMDDEAAAKLAEELINEYAAEEESADNEPDYFDMTAAREEFSQGSSTGISPAGTEDFSEGQDYKPFVPPKYNTVLEAMLDGKYKSSDILDSSAPEENKTGFEIRGRKIKLPEWEKVSRKDNDVR